MWEFAQARASVDECTAILPSRLYLTSLDIATNKSQLEKHKITHIVNASHRPNKYPDDFTYLTIDINDEPDVDINRFFTRTSRFIHTAILGGGVVLVHCVFGVSRSPTLVIAYLIQKHKMTLPDAWLHVAKRRRCVDPNEGFRRQLQRRFGDVVNTSKPETKESPKIKESAASTP